MYFNILQNKFHQLVFIFQVQMQILFSVSYWIKSLITYLSWTIITAVIQTLHPDVCVPFSVDKT